MTFADSEPEPNIAIVPGNEADFFKARPTTADLVIEVAVSSPALDRQNASLYASAGVREYWIVLATGRQVEVYREPHLDRSQERLLFQATEIITCGSVPAVQLRLNDLFV